MADKLKIDLPFQGQGDIGGSWDTYNVVDRGQERSIVGRADTNVTSPYEQLQMSQSTGEKWKNAMYGLGIGAVSGLVDWAGTLFENPISISKGLDDAYGDNILHNLAKSLNQYTQENLPIYQKDPDKIDFSDIGYLANGVQSMGTTFGMLIGNVIEMMALRGAGKLLRGGTTLAEISRIPSVAGKLGAMERLSGYGKIARDVGYGMFAGQREAIMNGFMTYDEIYETARDQGYSMNEARDYALQGASKAFNQEVAISVGMNALQFGMMGYNPVKGTTFGRMEKFLEKNIRSGFARKGIEFGIQSATEAFEENWQGASAGLGKDYAQFIMQGGKPEDYKGTWFNNGYWNTTEQWNDAILGGIMGGFFDIGGRTFQNIGNKFTEKRLNKNFESWRKEGTARRTEMLGLLKEAEDAGDIAKARELRQDINFYGAVTAMFQDNQMEGKSKQFDAYMLQMQEIRDAAKQGNADKVKILTGSDQLDLKALGNNLDQSIADATRLKEMYDNGDYSKFDDDVAHTLLYNNWRMEQNSSDISKIDQELQTTRDTTQDFQQLSQEDRVIEDGEGKGMFGFISGKTRFEAQSKLNADKNTLRYLNSQKKTLADLNADGKNKKIAERQAAIDKAIEGVEKNIANNEKFLQQASNAHRYEEGDEVIRRQDDTRRLESIGENQRFNELNNMKSLIEAENMMLQEDNANLKNNYTKTNRLTEQIQTAFRDIKTMADADAFLNDMKSNPNLRPMLPRYKSRVNSLKAQFMQDQINKNIQAALKEQRRQEKRNKKNREQSAQEVQQEEQVPATTEETTPPVTPENPITPPTPSAQPVNVPPQRNPDMVDFNHEGRDYRVDTKTGLVHTPTGGIVKGDEARTVKAVYDAQEQAANAPVLENPTSVIEGIPSEERTTEMAASEEVQADTEELLKLMEQQMQTPMFREDDMEDGNPAHEPSNDNMSGSPMTIQEQVDGNSAVEQLAMKVLSQQGTFQELMEDQLKRVGISGLKKLFPVYKYVYQKNLKELGKPSITPEGFDNMFKVLTTPVEEVSNTLLNMMDLAPVEVEISEKDNTSTKKDDTEADNPTQINILRTNREQATIAHREVPGRTVRNEDGSVEYKIQENQSANDGDFIDSTQLLPIMKFQAGTELTAKVPDNVDDIMVQIWNLDGNLKDKNGRNLPANTIEAIDKLPWGQAQQKYPQLADELYEDYVPVLIYHGTNPKAVGQLHTPFWYNPIKISEREGKSQAQVIDELQKLNRQQRQYILGRKTDTKLEVTERTNNKIDRMRDENNNPIYVPINQMHSETKLSIFNNGVFEANGLKVSVDDVVNIAQDEFGNVINENFKTRTGNTFMLIPVGIKNGRTQYEAHRTNTVGSKYNAQLSNHITNVVTAFVMSEYLPNGSATKDSYLKLLRSLGITNIDTLSEHLNLWMRKIDGNFEQGAATKLGQEQYFDRDGNLVDDTGQVRFQIIKGNRTRAVVFHAKNKTVNGNSGDNFLSLPLPIGQQTEFDAQSWAVLNEALGAFREAMTGENGLLNQSNVMQTFPILPNTDKNSLMNGRKIEFLTSDGTTDGNGNLVYTKTDPQTGNGKTDYESVMKDVYTTDILGIQDSQGNWHSSNQPTIAFKIPSEQAQDNPVLGNMQDSYPPIVNNAIRVDGQEIELSQHQQEMIEGLKDLIPFQSDVDILNAVYNDFVKEFGNKSPLITKYWNINGTLNVQNIMSGSPLLTENTINGLNVYNVPLDKLSNKQLNSLINYLRTMIVENFLDNTEGMTKRNLFNVLRESMLGKDGFLVKFALQAEAEIGRLESKVAVFPSLQKSIDKKKNELESISEIRQKSTEIINAAIKEARRVLDIHIKESGFKKGDTIPYIYLSSEAQQRVGTLNEFDIITILEANDDGTYNIQVNNETPIENVAMESIEYTFEDSMSIDGEDEASGLSIEGEYAREAKLHNESVLTQDWKQQTHAKTKMLLWSLRDSITGINEQGELTTIELTGEFGIPKAGNIDGYWSSLQKILGNPDIRFFERGSGEEAYLQTMISDYDTITVKLEKYRQSEPWINTLLNKLEEAPLSVKFAFVTDMFKYPISMKKVLYSESEEAIRHTLFNTMKSSLAKSIKESWEVAINNSPVITTNQAGQLVYNNDELLKSINTYSELVTRQNANGNSVLASFRGYFRHGDKLNQMTVEQTKWINDFTNWLNNFGLDLDINTVTDLLVYGYQPKRNPRRLAFSTLFSDENSGITSGKPFLAIKERMEEMVKKFNNSGEEIKVDNTTNTEFYQDMQNIINALAKMDALHNRKTITTSIREGSKTINGIQIYNFINQQMQELQNGRNKVTEEDPETVRSIKLKMPFNGASFDIQMMNDDFNYRTSVEIAYVSPEAMKNMNSDFQKKDNKAVRFSTLDAQILRLTGLMDTRQGKVEPSAAIQQKYPGLVYRLASFIVPTLSDKDTSYWLTRAAVNFGKNTFTFDVNNQITGVNESVKRLFIDNTVLPELRRIVAHYQASVKNTEHPNKLLNQDGTNFASQHFFMLYGLNNQMIGNENILKFLYDKFYTNQETSSAEELLQDENFYNVIDNFVTQTIQTDVKSKISQWEDIGLWNKQGQYLQKVSSDYFKNTNAELGGYTTRVRFEALAWDFVINSYISNANFMMMFGGDATNYATDKMYANQFTDNQIWNPKDPAIWNKLCMNGRIDTNIGKRMASMNASREIMAQSQAQGTDADGFSHSQYRQIIVQDRITIAPNLEWLIDLHYSKNALTAEVKANLKQIDDILSMTERTDEKGEKLNDRQLEAYKEKELGKLKDFFGKKFSYLKPLLNIETSDGQEYSTWREHLSKMYYEGIIDDKEYNNFKDKLSNGKPLNKKELKKVFQPLKPVYTGEILNNRGTGMQKVYIKTSSIPLLPQMTERFPNGLDGLRRYMEEIENTPVQEGKPDKMRVRLTYQSGVKAGLPLLENLPKVWKEDGTFNREGLDKDLNDNPRNINDFSLILERRYWGIQQNNPYKVQDRDADKIRIVTQMMKVYPNLLINIWNQEENSSNKTMFTMNGEQYNAMELYHKLNNTFQGFINEERRILYRDMGINPNTGIIEDPAYYKAKMEAFLAKEAEAKRISPAEMKNLQLEFGLNGTINFTVPIYLGPVSYKFEAMFNSLITKRLAQMKLPGRSFVVSTNAGIIADMSAADKSKMIVTDKFVQQNGKVMDAYTDSEGVFHPAQVIISSSFRMNDGTVIDLLEGFDGTDGKYVEKKNNSFQLKADMIDPELLQMMTNRIPYSGPQSGPLSEIIAFLPGEMYGDTMIVPDTHRITIGEDKDFDKRYAYQKWTYVDKEGRIRLLNEKFKFNDNPIPTDTLLNIYDGGGRSISHNGETKPIFDFIKDNTVINEEYLKKIKDVIGEANMDIFTNMFLENNNRAISNINSLEKEHSKLLQNSIIQIYESVGGSSNELVQSETNKVLSTDEAEAMSQIILDAQGQQNQFSSFLSEEYQTMKMQSGADAGTGIGIYSNFLVHHNMIQQLNEQIKRNRDENGKPIDTALGTNQIRLASLDADSNLIPVSFTFGNINADGILGKNLPIKPEGMDSRIWNEYSIEQFHKITDIFNELQNVSTDNEKLQLYYKLGLNSITANVHGLMTMLGIVYDTARIGGKEQMVNLPYFLISQKIIRDYSAKMLNEQSNVNEFNFDMETDVLQQMGLVKQNPNEKSTPLQELWEGFSKQNPNDLFKKLTGQILYDQLGNPTQETQALMLYAFRYFQNYAEMIGKEYNKINIQSNGIGRTIFDLQNVEESFNEFRNENIVYKKTYFDNNPLGIIGYGKLMGKFSTKQLEGYLPTGDGYFFKPLTNNGSMIYNSVSAFNDLFGGFYPFQNAQFANIFNRLLDNYNSKYKSPFAKTLLKQKVFEELKRAMFTLQGVGLYEGNIADTQRRILLDKNTKKEVPVNLDDVIFKKYKEGIYVLVERGDRTQFVINQNAEDTGEIYKNGYVLRKNEQGQWNRLFRLEQDEYKLSLATYLQKLMLSNSNVANIVKNIPMFKNITFENNNMSYNNGLSYFNFQDAFSNNLDQSQTYSSLISLIEMNETLDNIPGWNNSQPYTTVNLAEDLLLHSFLNQGGVESPTNYMSTIPVELLARLNTHYQMLPTGNAVPNSVSFLENLRTLHKIMNPGKTAVSAGLYSLMGMQTRTENSSALSDSNSVIERQVAQNLPQELPKLGSASYPFQNVSMQNINKSEIRNMMSNKLYEEIVPQLEHENYVVLTSIRQSGPRFMSMYDKRMKNSGNKKPYRVFERIGDSKSKLYKEIGTLGDDVVSEYDLTQVNKQSILWSNQPRVQKPRERIEQPKPVQPRIEPVPVQINKGDATVPQMIFGAETGSITTMLQNIATSGTPFSGIASLLSTLTSKMPIAVEIGDRFEGGISNGNPTIRLDQSSISDVNNSSWVAQKIIEETIHAILEKSIQQSGFAATPTYANYTAAISNGVATDTFGENLYLLFVRANKKFIENLGPNGQQVYNQKMAELEKYAGTGSHPRELDIYYGLSSIREFSARMLSNDGFIQAMNKLEYAQGGKSVFDKFGDILKQMFNRLFTQLGIKLDSNSVLNEGIDIVLKRINTIEGTLRQVEPGTISDNVSQLKQRLESKVGKGNPVYGAISSVLENGEIVRQKSETDRRFVNTQTKRILTSVSNFVSPAVQQVTFEMERGQIFGNIVDQLVRRIVDKGAGLTNNKILPEARQKLYAGIAQVQQQLAQQGFTLFATENGKPFNADLLVYDNNAEFVGLLDLIAVNNSTGEVMILDIKTTNNAQNLIKYGKWKDYEKQVNLYRIAAHNTNGLNVSKVGIVLIQTTFNEDIQQESKSVFDENADEDTMIWMNRDSMTVTDVNMELITNDTPGEFKLNLLDEIAKHDEPSRVARYDNSIPNRTSFSGSPVFESESNKRITLVDGKLSAEDQLIYLSPEERVEFEKQKDIC